MLRPSATSPGTSGLVPRWPPSLSTSIRIRIATSSTSATCSCRFMAASSHFIVPQFAACRSLVTGDSRPLSTLNCFDRQLWRLSRLCDTMNKAMPNEPRDIQKRILPNGLVVISETMLHVRSVSVGIWIRTGSRRETPDQNGIAHFIEHMVFKGTERRTAQDIARSIDSIGGMLDAFTAKEMICFNAKVLDEHLPIAFEIISDLVLRPRFDDGDLGKEKQVVLEEIKMELDNAEYLVHELFTQGFWPDHSLGRPILGTPETVRSFNRDAVFSCYRPWYAPDNMVITAAGNLGHPRLVELVEKEFGRLPASGFSRRADAPSPQAPIRLEKKRDLEQVHICIGVPAYPMAHERRFATAVLNNILGGGMSSRLFQKIREQHGLAYAVFSELSPYSDTGMLSIYAGTAK